MAIRFVIGRAGSGKTTRCLASVHRLLQADPVQGERLILLVPEQASLQTERALLDHPHVGATDRAEVLSFRRLAHRVLVAAGVGRGRAVSSAGRNMILRQLIGRLRDDLTVYRDIERRPGLVDSLAGTVTELINESVAPQALAEAADACRDDPLTHHKLHDLAQLYAAYLAYLGDDKVDPSQHLELACRHLRTCGLLEGARFWVDGFAGFTGQQLGMLVELARVAAEMEITLMIDPAYAARAGDLDPIEPGDLFAKIQRTYLDARSAFAEAGLTVAPAVNLAAEPPPRFNDSPELAHLERTLFTRQDEAVAPADLPGDGTGSAVTLVRLSDRRAEVDYVVSLVCHLVHAGAGELRYRDIALILRDLDPYHDLLSAALDARHVPYFMDRRRPTSHHPLVELLRGLVMLVERPFALDAVRLLLKTGLVGIGDTAADELENHLLAGGLEGPDVWRQADDWAPLPARHRRPDDAVSPRERAQMDRINRARRAFLQRVGSWYDAAADGAFNGRDWARLIGETLERLAAARRLTDWAADAEEEGNLDLAEQHRQILRDIGVLLEDLCVTFGDTALGVSELDHVLSAGLSQLTLGLAPPMLDQVLVGSIERSRHPAIRVAIVVGFNEGVFPHLGFEDAILNDDDRVRLAGRGIRLRPPRAQRILDESLLAYTAATRASQKVYITYAESNEEGQPLRPSPYVDALKAACPNLVEVGDEDGFRHRNTTAVWTTRDLAERLTYEFRNRPAVEVDSDPRRGRWNDLYELARHADDLRVALRASFASFVHTNDAVITPQTAEELSPVPLRTSVSRVETFAMCPFKHFARYGLGLQERKQAALADVDVGTIHHAILEQFVRGVVARRESLADLDDGQIQRLLQSSCDAVTEAVTTPTSAITPRDRYMLRRCAEGIGRVVDAQRRLARSGRFRPRGAEVAFGVDEPGSLPALQLTTPRGRRVLLRGYIDRVDLAELADETLGVVVDYKRTRGKRLDLSHAYHGLSLQLLAYLLVLADRGESLAGRPVEPVGAFYVSLLATYRSVEHPDRATTSEEASLKAFGPRGILNADRFEVLDSAYGSSGWSQFYKLHRTSKGQLGYIDQSDAAASEAFGAMLKHTRRKLGELADEIIDGNVAVQPCRLKTYSPCSWCEFAAVCRFEFGPDRPRYLEPLKRSSVFEKLTGSA